MLRSDVGPTIWRLSPALRYVSDARSARLSAQGLASVTSTAVGEGRQFRAVLPDRAHLVPPMPHLVPPNSEQRGTPLRPETRPRPVPGAAGPWRSRGGVRRPSPAYAAGR